LFLFVFLRFPQRFTLPFSPASMAAAEVRTAPVEGLAL
jgi:hypothetical protein